MKCPTCESENTQRLETAYRSGTQNISTFSTTAGAGIGGGRLGGGGGVTRTSGQQQSMLASSCMPPSKVSYKWPIIGLIAGFFLLIAGSATFLIGLVIGGGSGYLFYTRHQFNTQKWPSLYQRWSESWICNKCGNMYHHPI